MHRQIVASAGLVRLSARWSLLSVAGGCLVGVAAAGLLSTPSAASGAVSSARSARLGAGDCIAPSPVANPAEQPSAVDRAFARLWDAEHQVVATDSRTTALEVRCFGPKSPRVGVLARMRMTWWEGEFSRRTLTEAREGKGQAEDGANGDDIVDTYSDGRTTIAGRTGLAHLVVGLPEDDGRDRLAMPGLLGRDIDFVGHRTLSDLLLAGTGLAIVDDAELGRREGVDLAGCVTLRATVKLGDVAERLTVSFTTAAPLVIRRIETWHVVQQRTTCVKLGFGTLISGGRATPKYVVSCDYSQSIELPARPAGSLPDGNGGEATPAWLSGDPLLKEVPEEVRACVWRVVQPQALSEVVRRVDGAVVRQPRWQVPMAMGAIVVRIDEPVRFNEQVDCGRASPPSIAGATRILDRVNGRWLEVAEFKSLGMGVPCQTSQPDQALNAPAVRPKSPPVPPGPGSGGG